MLFRSISGSYSNSTALGYGASVTESNQMVFGNASITNNIFKGKLTLDGGSSGEMPFGTNYLWRHYGTGTGRVVNTTYGGYDYPIEVSITCISNGSVTANDACELLINTDSTTLASDAGSQYSASVVDGGVTFGYNATTLIPLPLGYTLRAIIPAGSYYRVQVWGAGCVQGGGTNSWRECRI